MLDKFIKYVNDNNLGVDSIIITKNNIRYEYYFKKDYRRNIRSISKVVSGLAVLKAIENKLFTLDSNVMDFFSDVEIYNKDNLKYLNLAKIKHLLNLTLGHEKGLMFAKDRINRSEDIDYISYILNYDIKHKPGIHFVYTNANTYLLCAIIQSLTNMDFIDWTYENILKDLDIDKPKWEKSKQGICLGASGLYLNNNELHKIGLLLLNEGKYNGKQIIDSLLINKMHEPHFITSNLTQYLDKQKTNLNKMAYGYHLWISRAINKNNFKSHYFCDGTDGQFLIISPKQNMVISVLSNQKDMEPLYAILSEYLIY